MSRRCTLIKRAVLGSARVSYATLEVTPRKARALKMRLLEVFGYSLDCGDDELDGVFDI